MIEYLQKYQWDDLYSVLHKKEHIGGGAYVTKFNPPEHLKYNSRLLDDSIIFFKSESDMIAFDNWEVPSIQDQRLVNRGKYLVNKITNVVVH